MHVVNCRCISECVSGGAGVISWQKSKEGKYNTSAMYFELTIHANIFYMASLPGTDIEEDH